eukprot:gene36398-49028_t
MIASVSGVAQTAGVNTIPYSAFLDKVEAGTVGEVNIAGEVITGSMKNNEKFRTYAIPDPQLADKLRKNSVTITAKPEEGAPIWQLLLYQSLPFLLMVGLAFFVIRQMQKGSGSGAMGFGKSRAKMLTQREGKDGQCASQRWPGRVQGESLVHGHHPIDNLIAMNATAASTPAAPPLLTASQSPWLVADIGGTHARFGLVERPGLAVTQVQRLRTQDHPQLIDAARAYLDALPPSVSRLTHACLAVAAPLDGDEVRFINHPWRFSREALQRELGLERLILRNDFEALALALPHLRAAGLRAHAPGHPPSEALRAALAVVGPGTGLGVAGLIPTTAGWQAIPGEGGHVTLAASTARRLLSGVGLPLLHRSVAAASGRSIDVAMRTEAILQRGIDHASGGGDADCARTLAACSALPATVPSSAPNTAVTASAAGIAMFGALLALPALKVTGPYLAMVTLAFGTIIQILINEMTFLTEGPMGITMGKPQAFGVALEKQQFFWVVAGVLVFTLIVVH